MSENEGRTGAVVCLTSQGFSAYRPLGVTMTIPGGLNGYSGGKNSLP